MRVQIRFSTIVLAITLICAYFSNVVLSRRVARLKVLWDLQAQSCNLVVDNSRAAVASRDVMAGLHDLVWHIYAPDQRLQILVQQRRQSVWNTSARNFLDPGRHTFRLNYDCEAELINVFVDTTLMGCFSGLSRDTINDIDLYNKENSSLSDPLDLSFTSTDEIVVASFSGFRVLIAKSPEVFHPKQTVTDDAPVWSTNWSEAQASRFRDR